MFTLDQKEMQEIADSFEKEFQKIGPEWFVDEAIARSNGLVDNDDYYKLVRIVASEQKAKLKWKLTRTKFVGMVLGGDGTKKKHLLLPRGHRLFAVAERMGMFISDALRAIHVNLDDGVFTENEAERRKEKEGKIKMGVEIFQ